jgi:hypothetical protein
VHACRHGDKIFCVCCFCVDEVEQKIAEGNGTQLVNVYACLVFRLFLKIIIVIVIVANMGMIVNDGNSGIGSSGIAECALASPHP